MRSRNFALGQEVWILENGYRVRACRVAGVNRQMDMFVVRFGDGSRVQLRADRLFADREEARKAGEQIRRQMEDVLLTQGRKKKSAASDFSPDAGPCRVERTPWGYIRVSPSRPLNDRA